MPKKYRGPYTRTIVAVLIVIGATAPLRAQSTTADDMAYAEARGNGPEFIPDSIRRRIAGTPQTMEAFAGLLRGTTRTSVPWDSAVVLWWLAESNDKRYVPLFLAGSNVAKRRSDQFDAAVYGLTRHADVPAAAARLRAIAEQDDAVRRMTVIGFLARANTVPARGVLQELHDKRFDGTYGPAVERLLRAPPASNANPRWCGKGEKFGPDNMGVHRCHP